MNSSKQIKVDLIIHDGDSEGIWEIKKSQSSFKIIGFPKDRFQEIQDNSKFLKDEQPGVYILIGSKGGDLDEYYYYTGESEKVKTRLSNHQSDMRFWTDTILLISTAGNNITKSHVRYIESKLFSKVSNASRWTRWTKSGRTRKPSDNAGGLPDYERNSMDEIINLVPMLVLSLGWDIFRSRIEPSPELESTEKSKVTKDTHKPTKGKKEINPLKYPEFYFSGLGFSSKMIVMSDKEFVVIKESTARINTVPSLRKGILDLRENLISSGVLKKNNGVLVFTRDHTFKSPSTAAETIAGRNERGPTAWKMTDGKTTYAGWRSRSSGTSS